MTVVFFRQKRNVRVELIHGKRVVKISPHFHSVIQARKFLESKAAIPA